MPASAGMTEVVDSVRALFWGGVGGCKLPCRRIRSLEVEVAPGVHIVPGGRWSRMYLIEGETLTLVDSGLPWSHRHVLKYVRSLGRHPDELRTILTTHSHPDHTTGARSIVRRTGAEILAHPLDTKPHRDGTVSLSYMGVFTSLDLPIPFLERAPVGTLVADGDLLPDHGGIRVIHSPGHTPGSVSYLLEGRGGALLRGHALQRWPAAEPVGAVPRLRRGPVQAHVDQAGRHGVRYAVRRPRRSVDRRRVGPAPKAPGGAPRSTVLGRVGDQPAPAAVPGPRSDERAPLRGPPRAARSGHPRALAMMVQARTPFDTPIDHPISSFGGGCLVTLESRAPRDLLAPDGTGYRARTYPAFPGLSRRSTR